MSAPPQMLPSTQQPSSTSLSPWIVIMPLLVLSVALCLIFRNYHRLLDSLSRLRRSNHHSFNPPAGPAAAATVQSLINSLPLFKFSNVTRCSNASAVVEADCAVCLSRFVSRDTLRLLPLCRHAFHSRCIDTWLSSGHMTCPLCRSDVNVSAALILLPLASSGSRNGSFQLEIGSVRPRHNDSTSDDRSTYSIGSLDYVMEVDTEIVVFDNSDGVNNHPVDLGDLNPDHSRSWLGECMDRLSSRTASFRSSRGFFTGSSFRSEVADVGVWDVEAGRVAEEIGELFRWASGT